MDHEGSNIYPMAVARQWLADARLDRLGAGFRPQRAFPLRSIISLTLKIILHILAREKGSFLSISSILKEYGRNALWNETWVPLTGSSGSWWRFFLSSPCRGLGNGHCGSRPRRPCRHAPFKRGIRTLPASMRYWELKRRFKGCKILRSWTWKYRRWLFPCAPSCSNDWLLSRTMWEYKRKCLKQCGTVGKPNVRRKEHTMQKIIMIFCLCYMLACIVPVLCGFLHCVSTKSQRRIDHYRALMEFAVNLKYDVVVVPRNKAYVSPAPDGKRRLILENALRLRWDWIFRNGYGVSDGMNEKGLAVGLLGLNPTWNGRMLPPARGNAPLAKAWSEIGFWVTL